MSHLVHYFYDGPEIGLGVTVRKHVAQYVMNTSRNHICFAGRTIRCGYSTKSSTLMPRMIEMNGPDIEEVDEVKVLILESVNVWNYENVEKRVSSLKG